MSEEEEAGAPAAAAPGKSKALPILLVINTLLLTGVLIFVMKRPAAHAAPEGGKAAAEGEHGGSEHGGGEHGGGEDKEKAPGGGHDEGAMGPTVRFENFTVQLKSLDVDRYAHMAIEIEVADEGAKGMVEKKVPPIRDAILSYLSDRTPDELRGSDGLKEIKESMIKKLDELIPGHRIRNLYITDFIIQ